MATAATLLSAPVPCTRVGRRDDLPGGTWDEHVLSARPPPRRHPCLRRARTMTSRGGCWRGEHPRAPRARARRALAIHRRPREAAAAEAIFPRHRRGREVRGARSRHQEELAQAVLPRALQTRQSTFENAPDVSARDMKLLRDNFTVCTSEVVETKTTEDGSGAKMVVRLHDGKLLETAATALAPPRDDGDGDETRGDGEDADVSDGAKNKVFRNTVCVSSQAGCAMGCTFWRDRHPGPYGQPHRGRDMRAGLARAQPLRIDRRAQRGDDGDGRAARQLRGGFIALRAMTHQAAFDMRQLSVTVDGWSPGSPIRRPADDAPNVGLALSLHASRRIFARRSCPPRREPRTRWDGSRESPRYHRQKSGGRQDRVHRHRRRERPRRARAGRARRQDAPGGRRRARGVRTRRRAAAETEKGAERVFVNLIPYNPTDVGGTHGYRSPRTTPWSEWRRSSATSSGSRRKCGGARGGGGGGRRVRAARSEIDAKRGETAVTFS